MKPLYSPFLLFQFSAVDHKRSDAFRLKSRIRHGGRMTIEKGNVGFAVVMNRERRVCFDHQRHVIKTDTVAQVARTDIQRVCKMKRLGRFLQFLRQIIKFLSAHGNITQTEVAPSLFIFEIVRLPHVVESQGSVCPVWIHKAFGRKGGTEKGFRFQIRSAGNIFSFKKNHGPWDRRF